MPLVTVVIPTYNREQFIRECVDSVLNQTFRDFELIVVDDGSTDGTVQVLGPVLGEIHFVKQWQQGPSAARNHGILLSAGEWLCFLDSDDLWLPGKLESQHEYIQQNPETRVCYTEEIWYRKGRRVNPAKKHRKYSGFIYQRLLPLCIISPSSVMIHRSVFDDVGLFDETLPACEDYDLWLRIGARYPIHLLPEPLIIKRNGHEGQQSQKFWGMDRFRIQALVKMLDQGGLSLHDRRATREMLRQKCTIVADGCEKRGKFAEALYYRQIMDRYQEENHAISGQCRKCPAPSDRLAG